MRSAYSGPLLEALHRKGYRITAPRARIAACLHAGQHSMSMDDIVRSVNRQSGPKLNLKSAYATIELFMKEDLVHEFLINNKKHYELPGRSEHLHLVKSDKLVLHVEEVDPTIKAAIAAQVARHGYEVKDFTIEVHVGKALPASKKQR